MKAQDKFVGLDVHKDTIVTPSKHLRLHLSPFQRTREAKGPALVKGEA